MTAGEPAVPHQLGYPRDYDSNAMYQDEMKHFLRCVDGAEAPCADVAWAARVTRLALAVKAAAAEGRTQPLSWDAQAVQP